MRILITNDDGIRSPALAPLVAVARELTDDVVVAAPNREFSGASASLLGTEHDGRLVVDRALPPDVGPEDDVEGWAVHAAPAMIVFAAAYGAFGARPDLVLSGVNLGANTGRATLHSGTVGGALSAAAQGIPGMAVSIASSAPRHLETARALTAQALPWYLARDPHCNQVLNLNVPDLPWQQLRGMRQAALASFGAVRARVKEKGHGHVTLTYAGLGAGNEKGTDAYLLARGWATLTLLESLTGVDDVDLPSLAGPASTDWVEHPDDDGRRPDAEPGEESGAMRGDGDLVGEVSTGRTMSRG